MLYSLIVATMNRNDDLDRLLHSLSMQSFNDFEIIIVDQNNDNKITEILLRKYDFKEKVRVVRPPNKLCASAARNYGSEYCSGRILGFPDDDCWYAPDILKTVADLFDRYNLEVLAGSSIDPRLGKSNAVLLNKSGFIIKALDLPIVGIEYSVFMNRTVFEKFKFDESISVGSTGPFQSGEITDLLINIYSHNIQIYYHKDLVIFHPFKPEGIKWWKKEYYYAVGFGYVLAKHNLYKGWFYFMFRSIGGIGLSVLNFNFENTLIRLIRLIGRFNGFIRGKML